MKFMYGFCHYFDNPRFNNLKQVVIVSLKHVVFLFVSSDMSKGMLLKLLLDHPMRDGMKPSNSTGAGRHQVYQRDPLSCRIPFGDHPLKLERYRED